jgi:transposase-like protein
MAFEDKTRPLLAGRQAPAAELLREMVSMVVQDRIRTEFEHFLGAAPYERTPERRGQVRREGHVRATAALWVVGVTQQGYREHLGIWLGASESESSWAEVFHDLTQRGLHGVTYVVSDDHVGLRAALRRYFPDAVHQRCQVDYLRNALSKVSSPTTRSSAAARASSASSRTRRVCYAC